MVNFNRVLICTVKSLFSAPDFIYFNPCRTTGAKRRTALKRGRRLIFERQIMDLRLYKTMQHVLVKTAKRRESKKKTLQDPAKAKSRR